MGALSVLAVRARIPELFKSFVCFIRAFCMVFKTQAYWRGVGSVGSLLAVVEPGIAPARIL